MVSERLTLCIDLTDDNSDKDNSKITDDKFRAKMPIVTKRRLSDSVIEEPLNHNASQAGSEKDFILPTRKPPRWSFGNLKQSYGVSKAFKQPIAQSNVAICFTDESIAPTVGRSTRSSPDATVSSYERRRCNHQTKAISAKFPDQAVSAEVQMQNAKLENTTTGRPRKRHQSFFGSSDSINPALANFIDAGKDITRISYLSDEELDAYLESENSRFREDNHKELPPEGFQEIIDLEDDRASGTAEEIEDEEPDEYMSGPAIDETDEILMNIVEISSDDDDKDADHIGHKATGKHHGFKIRAGKRPSTLQNVSSRFERLYISVEQPEPLAFVNRGVYIYRPGDGVEFENGTFMRIKSIVRGRGENICLLGPLLTRHYLHCLDNQNHSNTHLLPLSGRGNELVWTVSIDEMTKPGEEFVERELSAVLRPRDIHFTNQTWPCASSQIHNGGFKRKTRKFIEEGPLFCRWKRIKQSRIKQLNRSYEDSIVRLTETEADEKYTQASAKLGYAWRRIHVPQGGGSATETRRFAASEYATTVEEVSRYTFADCFCGCGGASRGAELAGLSIKWALDHDPRALKSYLANFKLTKHYQEDVNDFLSQPRDLLEIAGLMVDVLHMSPPCQAFSLARTRGSEAAGDAIKDILCTVGSLLNLVKPRIATLEQTDGIYKAHKDWMAMAIRDMIDEGYSVRWKIINSEAYGVPQIRKRLIIIAAAPGEALPPWPKPTHGPGLKPLATIQDRIKHIPANASHQQAISQFKNGPKAAYAPHTQASTVTCSGGDDAKNYHPSGLRPFTVRELACLQTFPVMHSFADANLTTAKKQIGNAVPPVLGRALFRTVIESLRETDSLSKRK